MAGVPRVARRSVDVGLGRRLESELRGVGLAHDHEPGLLELGEEVRVLVGDVAEVAQQPVAEMQWRSREITVEILTWAFVEMGRGVPAPALLDAVSAATRFGRRVSQWWADGWDLLLTPTLGEPPVPHGTFDSTPEHPAAGFDRAAAFVPFTAQFNLSGQPGISLPLHWNADGLPIGVQLVADFGREDLLLRVASQVEAAAPWADRRPPVSA